VSNINFYIEQIESFRVNRKHIREMIHKLIENEGKKSGGISIIFCSDEFLLDINKQHLNHNYFTDIITFDYVKDDTISGDLFISTDRVKSNSKEYKVSFNQELHRVIFHGILHLVGFKDKTNEEFETMKTKENKYLEMFQIY